MKTFNPDRDIVNQVSTVNESITIGGSLFTSSAGEPNIKKFVHWSSGSVSGSFYHAIYNANFSASSSVELVDVSFGLSVSSSFYLASSGTNKVEKNRMYKLFAKHLLGDENSLFVIDGANRNELIFVSIKRSQYKDEIKKGTVALNLIGSGSTATASVPIVFNSFDIADTNASNIYEQTVRGDAASLFTGSIVAGKIWYHAGIAALIPEKVSNTSSLGTNAGNWWSGSADYVAIAVSGGAGTRGFEHTLDAIRYRMRSLSFVNQSNLHSTFYFCRAHNDEFNYSSNPTFVDVGGRIIPTSGSTNLTTKTYITKVGLLGENNEVLAVASVSKPIKKTPETEFVLRVRLDF